ncbi:flagellar hook-associated protein FlgL [Microbacterium sp. 77mftsu3.1]|uniref:flagellar hook-associated protein FlgL n=1 Tax=Microbacterium sp. 77mftsu3.1 TaxID=1761802 RepID=UPI00035F33D2|nr:flagellar hook-associated protein FlgL [Microbacterium sp. 77mftsu3.1]SDH36941.1 flagellar hook-associated protein 3 FlgL [Microbacterium sp. 77mftsu3.1]
MITRVTSHSMANTALRNLQGNMQDLARLQEKATSQRTFTAASQDPSAAAKAMSLHAAQERNEQYTRNINDGLGWTSTADSAISSSVTLLGRVRDLAIQGSNTGAIDDVARNAIAKELDSLRDELLSQANGTYLGRPVFAGTSGTAAFDRTTYAHSGVAGAEVTRKVADGQSVRVDADGVAVFGVGADSVFALVDRMASDLRAGNNIGGHIAAIDDRRQSMLGAQGAVGASQAAIERSKQVALSDGVSLEEQRAAVEDVDTAHVIVQLQSAELVYQSALAVTARVLPPTLMEYLR